MTFRARRKRMREAFGVGDHCDGLSTDDEQNNLETTKFNSTRGIRLRYHTVTCRYSRLVNQHLCCMLAASEVF